MDPKKNQNTSQDTLQNNRRSFLKKAVYTAPSLLVLGSLVRPTKSMAADSWDSGPGSTDTWSGGQG